MHVGVVTGDRSVGSDQDDSGWLAGIGVERSGHRVHVFGRTQLASEEFVQIGLSEFEPRPKQRTFAGVGIDLERFGTVQFAYGHQSFWDSNPVETLGASYSVTLGAYGFVSLFANHTGGRVTADRCVPGLDDALGQSSQRRVERGLSTGHSRR